jgi:hypothetical protein
MEQDYWLSSDTQTGLGELYPPISAQTKQMIVYGTLGMVALAAVFWFMTRKQR